MTTPPFVNLVPKPAVIWERFTSNCAVTRPDPVSAVTGVNVRDRVLFVVVPGALSSCSSTHLLPGGEPSTTFAWVPATVFARLLADFVVGALPQLRADRLLTRDRGFYRSYFPELRLLQD